MKPNHSLEAVKFGFFKLKAGWCSAAWTPRGLCALVLPQASREIACRKLAQYLPSTPADFWDNPPHPVPRPVQNELQKALRGKTFQFSAFDLFFLTPFQRKVLQATCGIPWGQVRSYGWVAKKAGSPRGFRAAGQALNRNPVSLFVPCHRVIAGGNRLGGYGGGIDWKIRLLKNKKVPLRQNADGSYMVSDALIK